MWTRRSRFTAIAGLTLLGCSQPDNAQPAEDPPPPTDAGTEASTTPPDDSADPPDTSGPEDDGDDGVEPPKYDVAGVPDRCDGKEDGVFCEDGSAYTCEGEQLASVEECAPGVCDAVMGCVACVDGQAKCAGPRVLECDTSGGTPKWVEVEVCDPGSNEACDVGLRTCVPLSPIGSTDPTGTYYQYSSYNPISEGYTSICDADSYRDGIYIVAYKGSALVIAKYTVELLDSDGDGEAEPNQHPDNPDDPGPIEERVFTFVEDYPVNDPMTSGPNTMELYVLADRLYYGGWAIREYVFATGDTTQYAPGPQFPTNGIASMSFLGYDDIRHEWFSGSEGGRRVIRYDDETQQWGWAFEFPALAGAHMDGIEVVTAPDGKAYMYVSDMTSDFIAQYYEDPDEGWKQVNLFEYVEPSGAALEGFGFGALGHFWAGSLGSIFYELGGGDLAEFLEDPLAPE